MTLKELFGKVMVALDEAESDNLASNMKDYEKKIYDCVDSCQRELAVFIDNISKETDITVLDGVGLLPSDCFDIKGLYSGTKPISYDWITDKEIVASSGKYKLRYAAYPQKIDKNTSPSAELEISKEAQEALVYGVCAGLCINDEPELYSTYMDRYNGLCQSITEHKAGYPKARIMGGIRL